MIGAILYGYSYTSRHRLPRQRRRRQTVATYTYNALGQRTARCDVPRRQHPALCLRPGQSPHRRVRQHIADYIWVNDLPVAVVDTAGTISTVSYVTADGLGTPRTVSDGSGNTVWSLPYQGNSFAEQQPTSANGFIYNLRFPGQYFDAESGVSNNVNRDYEAATGRYLQSDPIGLEGGLSTYAYVGSAPLGATDPLGLQSLALCANPANAAACAAAGMGPGSAATGTAATAATGAATGGALSTGTQVAIGAGIATAVGVDALTKTCPQDDCDQRNKQVQDAKNKVGQLGACRAGMSQHDLRIRADAWLDLAIKRARRDEKRWAGGDAGHQEAQAAAWQNAAKCQGMAVSP